MTDHPASTADASLIARIEELEVRMAWQEQAIQALSDALAASRSEEGDNALHLHRIREELRQMRLAIAAHPHMADAASEPPPHY